jgi:hypothetical protein
MIDALVVVVCWSLVLWLYCWAAGSLIGRAADRLDRNV